MRQVGFGMHAVRGMNLVAGAVETDGGAERHVYVDGQFVASILCPRFPVSVVKLCLVELISSWIGRVSGAIGWQAPGQGRKPADVDGRVMTCHLYYPDERLLRACARLQQ